MSRILQSLKNKYTKALVVIGALWVLSLMLGVSYAVFQMNHKQSGKNELATACFETEFTELSESINLTNTYPMSDAKGLKTTPYTFKIKNKCNQYAKYAVTIDVVDVNTTIDLTKVKISVNGEKNLNPTILTTLIENSDRESGIRVSYIIDHNKGLYEDEEREYSVKIWMDESAGNDQMNKRLEATIRVTSIIAEEPGSLASVIYLPTSGDLIESIRFETHKNIPAEAIEFWDNSEEQDGKVMAWYTDIDGNNLYELFIGSGGGVLANPYSQNLFQNFPNLDSLDLTNLDTSKVEYMTGMFSATGSNNTKFTLNLGDKFDTSNVIDMSAMFYYTGYNSTEFTLDLGDKFDTSNVWNMSNMFTETGYSSSVFKLNLGDKFDTSNVGDMYLMFHGTGYNSTEFTLDLGDKFDTSNVMNMYGMFWNTGYNSPIFTLNLGNKFDTSNISDFGVMFSNAGYTSQVLTLDLGNKFDTSNATDFSMMFAGTGYSNDNFYINAKNVVWNSGAIPSRMFGFNSKVSDKFYAKDATAVAFITSSGMSGPSFYGTAVNCSSTVCP